MTDPTLVEDLQAFLAPGVTSWVMTPDDLPALAGWIGARYDRMQREHALVRRQRDEAWQIVCRAIDRGTTR